MTPTLTKYQVGWNTNITIPILGNVEPNIRDTFGLTGPKDALVVHTGILRIHASSVVLAHSETNLDRKHSDLFS